MFLIETLKSTKTKGKDLPTQSMILSLAEYQNYLRIVCESYFWFGVGHDPFKRSLSDL